MQSLSPKNKELVIKFDTDGLTPTQVRLIKSVHSLLSHVLAADEESEYFEASAELIRKTAELVKHSNFAIENNGIPYGDQAVEFAVDFLNESLNNGSVQNIDN